MVEDDPPSKHNFQPEVSATLQKRVGKKYAAVFFYCSSRRQYVFRFFGNVYPIYICLCEMTATVTLQFFLHAAGRPGTGQRTWLNLGGRAPAACRGRNLPGLDWTFQQHRCHWTSLPHLFRCFFFSLSELFFFFSFGVYSNFSLFFPSYFWSSP